MAVPHRRWTQIQANRYYAQGADTGTFHSKSLWGVSHIPGCRAAWTCISQGPAEANEYRSVVRGAYDWDFMDGANYPIKMHLVGRYKPTFDLKTREKVLINLWQFDETDIIDYLVSTGQTPDGVHEWDVVGGSDQSPCTKKSAIWIPDIELTPSDEQGVWYTYDHWSYSDAGASGQVTYTMMPYVFKNGFLVYLYGFYEQSTGNWNRVTTQLAAGTFGDLIFQWQYIDLYYLDPVVSALSRYKFRTAGGEPLVLTGVGFNNNDIEIRDLGPDPDGIPGGGGWEGLVGLIYLEGLQGQGTTTLNRALGDFSVDSDTQITIAAMPALVEGTYQLRLRKGGTALGDVDAYAGDWRAATDGLMTEGPRFIIYVTDKKTSKNPIITSKWRWKGATYIYRYYAPIDTRATETFWDGKILSMSGIRRGTNDSTGAPIFPDFTVSLANADLEFSKLLAQYILKNQYVEFFIGWQGEPEAWMQALFRGVVVDHNNPSSVFEVKLRDVLARYFNQRVPTEICSLEEYPNIKPEHIGRLKPGALGRCSHTEGDAPGAIEAVYIDQTTYQYLASWASLSSIIEVFADGALIDPADYAVTYGDSGETLITFTSDQESAKITFNCCGFMYDLWNSIGSDGGFVENPAWLLLFFFAFIVGVPEAELDLVSFFDLSELFEEMDLAADSAMMIFQEARQPLEILEEFCFSFGIKCWSTADGKIKVGRKDVSDYATDLLIFEQIDLLEEADKSFNFNEQVNSIKSPYGFIPTANAYLGVVENDRPASISDFEQSVEERSLFALPNCTNVDFAYTRTAEELLKRGYGNQKINIRLPIEWIFLLDVFDNFRFQDPYGINVLGLGDQARYFYAESTDVDPLQFALNVEGIDLQYLLRMYCVLGDENVLADNWATASEFDRLYSYLADETNDHFADGQPGKMKMNETTDI